MQPNESGSKEIDIWGYNFIVQEKWNEKCKYYTLMVQIHPVVVTMFRLLWRQKEWKSLSKCVL